jgi:fatty acid desaturase
VKSLPIPARLNLLLVAAVCSVVIGVQWMASHASWGWPVLAWGGVFSVAMVTLYTLKHEAVHGLLHPDSRWNHACGVLLGLFFLVPFSFYKHGHMGHHRRNRADTEMFDLYYAHDNRLLKTLYLWSILAGLFYVLFVALGVFLLLVPGAVIAVGKRAGVWTNGYVLGSIDPATLPRIRSEVLAIFATQAALFTLLDLQWAPYLALYACHAVFWSSQDYARHAFSPRDILGGAHNLRRNRFLSLVFLNNNCHLAHHRNPRAPWIHLPSLVSEKEWGPPLWRNYLRMLKGPELTEEPAPRSLDASFEVYREANERPQP